MKQLIKEIVEELNADLELEELNSIDDNTPLFELIDSVGVLDMILELEDKLQVKYGKYIQLADECTMDKDTTPFRTVGLLTDYLEKKVK